jgi:hypothetical protein
MASLLQPKASNHKFNHEKKCTRASCSFGGSLCIPIDKMSAPVVQSQKHFPLSPTSYPSSTGHLEFLPLDLEDLSTIKASVSQFLEKDRET